MLSLPHLSGSQNIHLRRAGILWFLKEGESHFRMGVRGFPDDSVVKNLPANAGDMGSVPGLRWPQFHHCLFLRTRTQAYLEKRLGADFYKVPRVQQ